MNVTLDGFTEGPNWKLDHAVVDEDIDRCPTSDEAMLDAINSLPPCPLE
jgi:hypothetical protein